MVLVVVIIHLQEGGHVLVKPLVSHDGGSRILARIPHLDEAILIAGDGEVRVQAEAGVQRGVVTLDPFVP